MHKKPTFLIFDGNALLHRAYHALPTTLATSKGEIANAVFGFSSVLLKVIADLKPNYMSVAWDRKAPTLRHKEYEDYKANRKAAPDDLYVQLPRIKEILKALNIPSFEQKGYEADDLIGTIARKIPKEIQTYIVTGDMDALQLIDGHTHVLAFKRGISEEIIYDSKAVEDKYGLRVDQIVDYKALRGDPSDNIPGVKGVGEKTATELLQQFQTLENLYKYAEGKDALKEGKIKERVVNLLRENKEEAFLSKKLAAIVTDVRIDFSLDKAEYGSFNPREAEIIFRELEFSTLIKKIPQPSKIEAPGTLFGSKSPTTKKRNPNYHLVADKVADKEAFNDFFAKLKSQKEFAFDTEATSTNSLDAELLGVSFSFKAGEAYYVAPKPEFLKSLKPILENPHVRKYGHNLKYDQHILENAGIQLQGAWFDTMVAAYMLDPGARRLKLDDLAFEYFKHAMIPIEDLIGQKGKGQKNMKEVDLETVAEYACEDADYTFQLAIKLEQEIDRHVSKKLFYEVEMPLIDVLSKMERKGVKIDEPFLKELSKKFSAKQKKIDEKIYDLAGSEFNINSPIQLQEILFSKLGISSARIKKTKTGISTAAQELDKLKGRHEIINLIAGHRELAKLRSTYVSALPELISEDGRVHTSFNQTITATGRLSSTAPNLQNIPIRTEDGRLIRKAFIAEKGNVLISADYSQIELRIVASLSGDKNMISAFKEEKDIHTHTASLLFEVSEDDVTPDMRRKAKEANFGVLYGLGARGLSQRMEVPYEEARVFIDNYFTVYGGVKEYVDNLRALSVSQGYAETLLGRRRLIPELESLSPQLRSSGERMAVNMPIQGTASDIMKIAMLNVFKALSGVKGADLILQVHDELVVEARENDSERVAKLLRENMEDAYKLKVPLVVDVKAGKNWDDMDDTI